MQRDPGDGFDIRPFRDIGKDQERQIVGPAVIAAPEKGAAGEGDTNRALTGPGRVPVANGAAVLRESVSRQDIRKGVYGPLEVNRRFIFKPRV